MNKKTQFTSLYRRIQKGKKEVFIISAGFLAIFFVLLGPSAEASIQIPKEPDSRAVSLEIAAMQNTHKDFGVLPLSDVRKVDDQMTMTVSAYNSVVWQTDDTPCIGAQGTDICELLEQGQQTCAANFVPIGTILNIEGLGMCTVRDRMNARYYYRVDWYMGQDIQAARNWGIRKKLISIYR